MVSSFNKIFMNLNLLVESFCVHVHFYPHTFIAVLILNIDRQTLYKGSICMKIGQGSIILFQFNTSLDGVLTNLVHGEHCARYQIVSVPGTNIFLGMINHTCDLATAFCPCSMVSLP